MRRRYGGLADLPAQANCRKVTSPLAGPCAAPGRARACVNPRSLAGDSSPLRHILAKRGGQEAIQFVFTDIELPEAIPNGVEQAQFDVSPNSASGKAKIASYFAQSVQAGSGLCPGDLG